jgi:hypothetical protein
MEPDEFWQLNNKLAKAIGMTMFHPAKAKPPKPAAGEPGPEPNPKSPKKPRPRVTLAAWDRMPEVVEAHRDAMVRLAAQTPVVKDPRFIWTLPLWVEAGAEIEHVVITIRAMADMVASRRGAGHTATDGDQWFTELELRNSLTYGLGIATATVYSANIPHSVIRFPDFVHDLDGLYDALRFPAPVSREHFRATAQRVFDPAQVGDYANGDTSSS